MIKGYGGINVSVREILLGDRESVYFERKKIDKMEETLSDEYNKG